MGVGGFRCVFNATANLETVYTWQANIQKYHFGSKGADLMPSLKTVYGNNYNGLLTLKNKYGPANLFQLKQNI